MSSGSFIYPNVTSLPSSPAQSGDSERIGRRKEGPEVSREFDQIFDRALDKAGVGNDVAKDLEGIRAPLKFSAHAAQRLKDRKIVMDPMTLGKVRDAVDKADAKGVEDTLVLTSDAALIVNVKNRTVITALDRGSLSGNVFTNIDGAVIV